MRKTTFYNRPLHVSSAEIHHSLEQAGVKPTAQRMAIYQYILCEADHPTAEQIKTWADHNFPKLSLATVYNTLNTLVASGLVREIRLPHSESVFYDNTLQDHYHFLDVKSGELFDVDPTLVQVDLKLKRGFNISQVDVVLKGTRE